MTFAETPTSFTQSGTAAQFDPALGTLTSVDLVHTGTLTSRIQVESRDPAPATVVGNVDGTLTSSGPGVGGLVLHPISTQSFNASAFDGVVDFAGTSGRDFGAVLATDTKAVTLTAPGDLAAFVGNGTVSFTEAAVSNSFASGAGNLVSQVGTVASSTIDVVYHYLPQGNLKPGQYTVVQTVQPAGYSDGIDSRNGVPLPNSTGSDTTPVTLAAADLTSINFGEWLPNGLSGFVYLDADNNGLKSATEFGIATVEVTLRGVSDSGEAVKLATTTDANGFYEFANLRPGQYVISETQPKFFVTGRDTIGTQGGKAGSSRFSRIELRSGVQGINNNFGEKARPDCNLGLLLSKVAKGQPLPSSIGTNIQRYLPGLVAYAQEHPRGPAGRSGR
ncbi:MAG: choice-of-anchor E domain-containing protein [Singulisphaera sp.]